MEAEKEKFCPDACEDADSAFSFAPEHIHICVLEAADEMVEFFTRLHVREISESSIQKFTGIANMIGWPLTVVCEDGYVDRIYRDTYYTYFSRKHFPLDRNCRRFSFFSGELPSDVFYRYDTDTERFLQGRFVGICVLKPIGSGELGRTILDPGKLHLPVCHLRTVRFQFNVLGHTFSADAYPYSSQDTETMTCAEITVWSILEFYGTLSSEYQTILPSQILREMEKLSPERILPSRGLEYSWISKLFKLFGFSPRLYDSKAFHGREESFQKYFHYYVESGIPLAVGISGHKQGEQVKHSVVCIGHGKMRKEIPASALRYLGQDSINPSLEQAPFFPYLDSADLYTDYVIMDDNRIPYQVEPFGKLRGWDDSAVSIFSVPLHQHIFLEASDVAAIVNTVFANGSLGFLEMIPRLQETVDPHNPLILRTFLTPSTQYRGFRARNADGISTAAFYGSLQLPRYIWVAEISTLSSYEKGKIYGELLIDATSGRSSYLDCLILIRYLDHIGYRAPTDTPVYSIDRGLKRRIRELTYPYAMYEQNLRLCGKGGEEVAI